MSVLNRDVLDRAVGKGLFEAMSDPVLVADRDGVLLAVNRAAALYLNDAPDRLVGRRVTEMFPPDQSQRQLDVICEVFDTGEPFSEERPTLLGEANFVFQYTVRRIEDAEGRPAAVLCIVRDVTVLAALEGRYAELYEKATDALFALDSSGRFRSLNRQAEVMSGYRRDLIESVHFTQLLPPDEAERLRRHFEARVQGLDVPTEYEFRYLHASGEERWAELRISKEPSSAGVFQASLRDITPRKRLEAMRRDFLHMVSHGVKTPLAVIHGYANALSAERYGELAPAQHAPIRGMLEAAVRVRHLMEQFLYSEQLDLEGADQPVAGAVGEVLSGVVANIRGGAEDKGIRVVAELDAAGAVTVSDQRGLAGVVENFLSNAVKYTPSGGTIWLRGAVEGETFRVDVQDTGRGISEAELPRVFDRFFRSSTSSDTWGSGLGLHIARRLAERMAGNVAVTSRPGEGSCFTVRIPIR